MKELRKAERKLVESRLFRLEEANHFGDAKFLGDHLAELRWKNGTRVYFYKVNNNEVYLLLGGYKNAQIKEIKKARILLRRYACAPGK
ncbi:MAG: hypothetical protein ChlgKO_12820 [Chlamydiales bacterium]